MNVGVRVIPGARKREMKREGEGLVIKLLARPQEGKANRELVEYLADTFSVRKSDVRIISGEKGRKKVIALPLEKEEFDAAFATLQ